MCNEEAKELRLLSSKRKEYSQGIDRPASESRTSYRPLYPTLTDLRRGTRRNTERSSPKKEDTYRTSSISLYTRKHVSTYADSYRPLYATPTAIRRGEHRQTQDTYRTSSISLYTRKHVSTYTQSLIVLIGLASTGIVNWKPTSPERNNNLDGSSHIETSQDAETSSISIKIDFEKCYFKHTSCTMQSQVARKTFGQSLTFVN